MFQGLIGDQSNGGGQGDVNSNFSNRAKRNQLSGLFRMGSALKNVNNLMVNVMMLDMKKLKDKFKFPSTMKSAAMHKKAMQYGYSPPFDKSKGMSVCACCGLNVKNEPLPVCGTSTTIYNESSDEEQVFKVTSSVAFFFTFIKYLIVLFLLRFVVVDSFNIFSSLIDGHYCKQDCTNQFWSYASIVYKYNREDLMQVTGILSFLVTVLMVPFFLLYRRFQYTMYDSIDKSKQTQDDYSVFLEYVPILNFPEQSSAEVQFNYDEDLGEIFSGEIRRWLNDNESGIWEEPMEGSVQANYNDLIATGDGSIEREPEDIVKSITLCYDIERIEKIKNLRTEVMTKYEAKMCSQPEKEEYSGIDAKYDEGPEQVDFLNESEMILCKGYAQDRSAVFNATHFVGCAFISFKYQHYRDHILEMYRNDKESFKLKGHRMRVTEATFPSDIRWKNFRVSRVERRNRVIMSFVVLFVFLIVGFAALVGSDRLKSSILAKLEKEKNSFLPMGVTLITTVVTLIINYILQTLSYELTEWEHHQNKSNEKFSLTIKLVATQFLNTAVIYYILSLLRGENKSGMLSHEGLVFQISSLIVTSGAIQIFTNMANIPALMRRAKLWWFYREKNESEIPEFQVNLNRKVEYVEFDIAQRYAYYILQLWTVSFYVYVVPICGPAIALIMAIQYWVDKFNMFRRSSLFYELNYSLSRYIVKMAEMSILFFTIGVVVFSHKIYDSVHPLSIVALVISFIFVGLSLFLPTHLEKKFFQKYETCETASYDECEEDGKFIEKYWYCNPATKLIEEGLCTKRDVKKYEQFVQIADQEELQVEYD